MVTTLSPGDMCTGAILLDVPECTKMVGDFIAQNPDLWNEDIGVQ